MAKKKTKSVLDYDPLAWLNESDAEEESKPSPKTKKASAKKTVKKTAKKSVKKAVKKIVKKSAKKAVKKVVKKAVKAKKVTTKAKDVAPKVNKADIVEVPTEDEGEGFGFFTESAETTVEENNEAEAGFGFFTDDDVVESKTALNTITEDKANDEGFGFFDEDNNASDLETSTEDEGFGFFTDDENDVLEVENMETLNISKDDAINLGSELTIKTVAEVKNQISSLLTNDVDVVINAEEMIKIDTAGLQLLYSLKEALGETGHHIKWIGTSTVINDSAAIIGMPILAPKTKAACFGFFEENMPPKDAEDGSSGFF